MRKSLFRFKVVMGLLVIAVVACVGVGSAQGQSNLGPALAAHARHTEDLLGIPGVVGTAVGLNAAGEPAVKVYTKSAGTGGIPRSLDGVPVVVEVTGEIFALDKSQKGGSPSGKGSGGIDTTSRFTRPVPIGVSTGNEGECSAGTISARVTDGANVYALSNNHVYALENNAPLGSNILQPGLYDTNCTFSSANVIGTLSDFQPINFNCTCFVFCTCDASGDNTIDAAIAGSSTVNLGNATPTNGYGTPNSATAGATLSQAVQKYGRTTSLTKGNVSGVNATILVSYSSGVARFTGQIVVSANRGSFIKAGDSGSLLVTGDAAANPVGLLFAGDSSGKTAFANPIDPVLSRFGVTVDGKY